MSQPDEPVRENPRREAPILSIAGLRPPPAGMKSRAELELDESAKRVARAAAAGVDAFNVAGFPRRHRECAAARALPKGGEELRSRALSELSKEGGCVMLIGRRGTGKTQLATDLSREVARAGVLGESPSMLYAVLGELLQAERAATFGSDEQRRESPLARASKVGLLVLDELHERGETDWENRSLVHLFDRRYREMLRTVLITNFTQEEAAKRLPASVWDRIAESALLVECDWPSFRGRGET